MNSKAKFIVPFIIIAVIIAVLAFISASKKNNDHTIYEVKRGEVVQEVSETGTVQKGDKITLSFKTSGQLKKVYVEKGDEVKKGTVLAKLDNTQLYIQLQQAEANLDLAQAELNKLLAGASKEEIQVAQTKVDNARTTLRSARESLENAQTSAEQDLKDIYEDAFNTLNDSYLKLYNALTVVSSIQNTYFSGSDLDSLKITNNESNIRDSLEEMDFYLQKVKTDFTEQNVDFALVNFEKNLSDCRDYLTEIRTIIEQPSHKKVVSSSDKTSLDTQKAYINTAYSNIVGEQQDVASVKISNKTNLDAAENNVSAAQDALKAAEDNLSLVTAAPRKEDVNLYKAKVESAQAKVDILKSQIQDTILKSPIDGTITAIEKFAGEIIQPAAPIISILPSEPFEIKADIYEEDVVKIQEGDSVNISLVAFPDRIFKGKVVFIDPAEKIIDEVVYYPVTIDFETVPDGLKPGMTADIAVVVARKDNVLVAPKEAVKIEGSKGTVMALKNKKIEEKEISLGLVGTNDMVEIISGLEEGEKIITD